jgi:hypothetical protein
MQDLGFPQRFGFPVVVILDGDGSRIHTQNTAFLEKDQGYDFKIMREFLLNWSSKALDPKSYE